MGLESPSNRAERLARQMQVWGRIPPLSEVVDHIDAVTVQDVRAMAAHMISTAPSALALYGPIATAPDWQSVQDRRVA